MPYGYPATKIEWVALSPNGQGDPIPGTSISLTDYADSLTGGRVYVLKGITGFDAPTHEVFYDELNGLDGGLFRHARTTTREIFIPVIMWATSRPDFLELKRDFLARINPLNGPGRILVTEGDNTSRYLDCYYTGGAEGTYSEDEGGFFWQKYGLVFRAMDPYWYDASPVQINWTSGSADVVPFFGLPGEPFFGLRLNPSRSINGAAEVTSIGDFDAWPTWFITGPVEGVVFTAEGASEGEFTLNVSLGTGEVLYVDTRPSRRRILKLTDPPIIAGTNFWSVLEPGDAFWPLKHGVTTITITAGSVSADTAISMNYRPRYYSA
jgi:hypothetical protein